MYISFSSNFNNMKMKKPFRNQTASSQTFKVRLGCNGNTYLFPEVKKRRGVPNANPRGTPSFRSSTNAKITFYTRNRLKITQTITFCELGAKLTELLHKRVEPYFKTWNYTICECQRHGRCRVCRPNTEI